MQPLKSLAQGFLVATGLIWAFNIAALFNGGDKWLGVFYLMILLIPISGLVILKYRTRHQIDVFNPDKWRNLLFAFQGVALGFWMFDIITTVYAINVTGLAIELNPLGWPWGILGALAFYGPTSIFAYVLLFKFKDKIAVYSAIPLSLLTLFMGSLNMLAGAQNFGVFVTTAFLATNLRFDFFVVIAAFDIAVPLVLAGLTSPPKPRLVIK